MALTTFGGLGSLMGQDPVFHPSTWLGAFPDEFSTLFDQPTSSFFKDTRALASTNVDVKETPHEYCFMADLPGIKREEVKVQIEDGNVLSISGKRQKEEKQETDRYHRIERSTGSFQRRFRLPDNAEVDKIQAQSENGVLTVHVPKKEPREVEKPKAKEIQVQ
eukprot:jgi/Mesen1/4048/ME000213S03073